MRTRIIILLGAIFFISEFPAEGARTLALGTRFRTGPVQGSVLDERAIYRNQFLPWLTWAAGGQLSLETWGVKSFDYKAEIEANYLIFLSTLRLSQYNDFTGQTGITRLTAFQSIVLDPFPFFGFFGAFGIHQKFTTISGAPIFPAFTGNGINDFDLIARVGLRIAPAESFALRLEIANFEEILTFNLNNPFAQVSFEYRPDVAATWKVVAYGRYQVLLGFGRLDEMMVGAGIVWPLDAPPPAVTEP